MSHPKRSSTWERIAPPPPSAVTGASPPCLPGWTGSGSCSPRPWGPVCAGVAQHLVVGLLSDLQARAHNLAAEGLGMAREGTYPFSGALDGTAKLISSRRPVTAVPRELDRLYAQLASPLVTFVRGPPGDD